MAFRSPVTMCVITNYIITKYEHTYLIIRLSMYIFIFIFIYVITYTIK